MDFKEGCSIVQADPIITCPFYLENRCRFGDRCRNLHPVDQLLSSPNSSTKTKPKKKETIETEINHPKMRTASDVIHRIVWDPAINISDFRVIYLDRFTGLGCVTLAEYVAHDADDPVIPQHRIQQICYCPFTSSDSRCGWVVWEKKSRTDYVFGSAGNAGTIKLLDLIEHVNKTSRPLTN
ncbi:leukocyte receptor cluster member 9 [Daphnia magna]|uniref:leukocyte receptor cluster member 9 n=1 Tax=Daphnia magna TaxID=35525 RepID=UPI001E1BDA5D|nr:leukocyte receptor cluster member 9 [Daphnia magna]